MSHYLAYYRLQKQDDSYFSMSPPTSCFARMFKHLEDEGSQVKTIQVLVDKGEVNKITEEQRVRWEKFIHGLGFEFEHAGEEIINIWEGQSNFNHKVDKTFIIYNLSPTFSKTYNLCICQLLRYMYEDDYYTFILNTFKILDYNSSSTLPNIAALQIAHVDYHLWLKGYTLPHPPQNYFILGNASHLVINNSPAYWIPVMHTEASYKKVWKRLIDKKATNVYKILSGETHITDDKVLYKKIYILWLAGKYDELYNLTRIDSKKEENKKQETAEIGQYVLEN